MIVQFLRSDKKSPNDSLSLNVFAEGMLKTTPAHIILLIWQNLLVKANSVNIPLEKEL